MKKIYKILISSVLFGLSITNASIFNESFYDRVPVIRNDVYDMYISVEQICNYIIEHGESDVSKRVAQRYIDEAKNDEQRIAFLLRDIAETIDEDKKQIILIKEVIKILDGKKKGESDEFDHDDFARFLKVEEFQEKLTVLFENYEKLLKHRDYFKTFIHENEDQ